MGKTVRHRSRQDYNFFKDKPKPTTWLHEQYDPEEFIKRGVYNYQPMTMKRDYINPAGYAAQQWTDMIPCNGFLDRLDYCLYTQGANTFKDGKCFKNFNESMRCLTIFKDRLDGKKFMPEQQDRATENPYHKNKMLEGL